LPLIKKIINSITTGKYCKLVMVFVFLKHSLCDFLKIRVSRSKNNIHLKIDNNKTCRTSEILWDFFVIFQDFKEERIRKIRAQIASDFPINW
jgi:hypothetical protein